MTDPLRQSEGGRADFLFVTGDEALGSELSGAAEKCGASAAVARVFDEALEVFLRGLFRAVLVDIRDPLFGGLRALEWMAPRRPLTLMGVLCAGSLGEDVLKAASLGAGVFCGDFFREGLDRRLRNIIAVADARRDGVVHAIGAEGEAWVGESPVSRAVLDRVLCLSRAHGRMTLTGPPGSGRRLLAEAAVAEAGGREVRLDATSAGPADMEAALGELALGGGGGPPFLIVTDAERLPPEAHRRLVAWLGAEGPKGPYGLPGIITTVGPERAGKLPPLWRGTEVLVPGLSSRRGDIPLIAAYFLEKGFAPGRPGGLAEDATAALTAYAWPGGVAELKRVVEEAAKAGRSEVTARDLPASILKEGFYMAEGEEMRPADMPYDKAKGMVLHRFNRDYITTVIARAEGNLTVAAEFAGMDRSNFKKIIKKYFPKGMG